ncbi:MAG: hypothetical protein M3N29_02040 [Chloroflexota bacterium]|nr:hypothetical protein [Chloroflexota bacterium]
MTDMGPTSRTGADTITILRAAVVVGLVLAGVIHLWLGPGHLTVSPILGVGFLATGLAQAILAGVLLRRRSRAALVGAIIVSAFGLVAYAVDVTVGLPGASHGALHADAAGAAGHGEAIHAGEAASLTVDPGAVAAKLGEAVTLVAALLLYRRP